MNSKPHQIGIASAAAFLPGAAIEIDQWAVEQKVPLKDIDNLKKNGCRLFYAANGESDVDLIENALENLDAPPNWQAKVGYLIHAHTQPFSIPAPPGSVLTTLCHRWNLRPSLAYSISHLACASVISAVDSAVKCLQNDRSNKTALIVTSDRVFGGAPYRLRGASCIQSDGASAILIGRDDLKCILGHFSFKSYTQLHEGPSTPILAAMMGHFLGRHTVGHLEAHVAESNIPLTAIDEILPTNADMEAWEEASAALNLSRNQIFYDNIGLKGHACCADLAMNLADRGFTQLQLGRKLLAVGTSNIGAFASINLLPI